MSNLSDLIKLTESKSPAQISVELGRADSFADAVDGRSRGAMVATYEAPTLDDLAARLAALNPAELRFASEPLKGDDRWRVRVGAFTQLL